MIPTADQWVVLNAGDRCALGTTHDEHRVVLLAKDLLPEEVVAAMYTNPVAGDDLLNRAPLLRCLAWGGRNRH